MCVEPNPLHLELTQMVPPRSRYVALLSCVLSQAACWLVAPLLVASVPGCVSIFSDDSAFVEGDPSTDDTSGSTNPDGTTSGTTDPDGTTSGTTDTDGTTSGADADVVDENFTAAVIHIDPPQPKTLDDLTLVIDQEATHTGGGEVTYEYAWSKGGQEVAEVAGQTVVDDALTTKAEVWTVSVTPVSGADRGVPITASVTIENTRPVVRSASLDSYALFENAEVNARLEDIFDADGDQIAPVVRWFKVRDAQSNQITLSGTKLDLSTQTWQPGDMLRVEVSAYDTEGPTAEGEKYILGPIPVYQAVPYWKPLYPNFTSSDGPGGTMLYDPYNRRLLFINQGVLWEASPPDEGQAPRWVALNPAPLANMATGTSPFFFFPVTVFDEGTDYKRILFIGAAANDPNSGDSAFTTMRIIELDVTHRGGEQWIERTPVLGGSPPLALIPSTLHDRERDRLLIFGGLAFGDNTIFDQLWSLDLTLRGGEAWTQLTPEAGAPSRGGALWLKEPGSDRTLLVGGFGVKTQPNTTYEYLTDVWSYDLSVDPPKFEPLITTAPGNIAGMIETYGQEEGSGLIITTSAAEGHTLWRFDFNSQVFSEIADAEAPPAQDALQIFTAFLTPGGEKLVMNSLATDSDNAGLNASAFDFAAAKWSKVVSNSDSPLGLIKALMAFDSRDNDAFYIHGGRTNNDEINGDVWKFDLINNTWSKVTPDPDPVHGVPAPRYGHGGGGQGRDYNGAAFYSGVGASGGLNDAWRLVIERDKLIWNRLRPSPRPPPTPNPRSHAPDTDSFTPPSTPSASTAATTPGSPGTLPHAGRHRRLAHLQAATTTTTFHRRLQMV